MQDAIALSVKQLYVPVHSSAGTQKASQHWDGITGLFETIKKICGLAERLKLSEVCVLLQISIETCKHVSIDYCTFI